MQITEFQPTRYPDINALLHELLSQVQTILGNHFVGMYLDGSLTSHAFDEASDIDCIVVTDVEIDGTLFRALQVMHEHITKSSAQWAIQLEGSYISHHALRRYDPDHSLHPNIERGPDERLKMVHHDASWVIHRYIVRQRGITLAGPPPHTLIDPITPTDLRQAMVSMLPAWTAALLNDPGHMRPRGYHSYLILSLCRVLYTLHFGTVASKPEAAQWARASLEERWGTLIDRAWEGRYARGDASDQDIRETIEFIRYTLEQSQRNGA
ncbi:MAG: DUF4111 domain-containing protein [Chloroflexota bacterium]|nr:DUF4111 domain-containing protein [Chloroflexota bacterium]